MITDEMHDPCEDKDLKAVCHGLKRDREDMEHLK